MGAEDGTPITVGQFSGSYAKQYTYDLAGNRTSLQVSTDSTVQNISHTYDVLNRLATVSESGRRQAAYAYDTNGNRASLTYANGVTETYRYNKANWVILLENRNKRVSFRLTHIPTTPAAVRRRRRLPAARSRAMSMTA